MFSMLDRIDVAYITEMVCIWVKIRKEINHVHVAESLNKFYMQGCSFVEKISLSIGKEGADVKVGGCLVYIPEDSLKEEVVVTFEVSYPGDCAEVCCLNDDRFTSTTKARQHL